MDLLDHYTGLSLPMAYSFYKSAIENDGGKIEFDADDREDMPSIDLKIVAQYARLLGKAMILEKIKDTDNWNNQFNNWLETNLIGDKNESI